MATRKIEDLHGAQLGEVFLTKLLGTELVDHAANHAKGESDNMSIEQGIATCALVNGNIGGGGDASGRQRFEDYSSLEATQSSTANIYTRKMNKKRGK